MEQEAEFDEQNGWVRYTHDTPSISEEVETVEEATKVATMDAEAEYDEANGWERYELDTQLEPVVEVEEVIAAPVNTLEKRTRRKTTE
jgi:hypothetical protein